MNMKAQKQRQAQQRANARIAKMAHVRRRVNAQNLQREHYIAPQEGKCLKDRVILINVIGATVSNILFWIAGYGKEVAESIDPAVFVPVQSFLLQLVGA